MIGDKGLTIGQSNRIKEDVQRFALLALAIKVRAREKDDELLDTLSSLLREEGDALFNDISGMLNGNGKEVK